MSVLRGNVRGEGLLTRSEVFAHAAYPFRTSRLWQPEARS